MHLKSLTLKGFKSFASATTLKFEPGICAVVGPNGSGKSNVVDALTWVMGEQGAKNLRGGKMEDVIFAGAGERKPLGRAEVTLTIDNADGQLPIDYSEVSITRRMFRDGASEYEINGAKARLMDIQELLSDSGIGREMHIIVGQNKLGDILSSRPEERRAYIEEAAGVLKHRRRKEKAQRKLASMQANLDRLQDLTDELGKQLGPLAKQAETASRAAQVQAEVREARLALAGFDLVSAQNACERASQQAAVLREKVALIEEELESKVELQKEIEATIDALTPESENIQAQWFRLSTLVERLSATIRVAGERARSAEETQTFRGQDADELEARALQADEEHEELTLEVEEAAETVETIRLEMESRQAAYDEAEAQYRTHVQALADRREGVVRLIAAEESLLSRISAAEEEISRHDESLEVSRVRVREVMQEVEVARNESQQLQRQREPLEQAHGRAQAEMSAAEKRLEQLSSKRREHEKVVYSLRARIETLEQSLPAEESDLLQGLTPVTQHMKVSEDHARAVAAVLGEHARARVGKVGDGDVDKLQKHTRTVIVTPSDTQPWRLQAELPAGAQWLLDVIALEEDITQALTRILADVVLVENFAQAKELTQHDPRLRAVTPQGLVVGEGWIQAGASAPGEVEVTAQIETAAKQLTEAEAQLEQLAGTYEGARTEAEEARVRHASATAALREFDARTFAADKELQRLDAQVAANKKEHEREAHAATLLESCIATLRDELQEIRQRLSLVEGEDSTAEEEVSTNERDRALEALNHTRTLEVEAQMKLRSVQDRLNAHAGKAEGLRRQAAAEREAFQRHQRAVHKRKMEGQLASRVEHHARDIAARAAVVLEELSASRENINEELATARESLQSIRAEVSSSRSELDAISKRSHEADMTRERAQVRLDEVSSTITDSLGIALADILSEHAPAPDFDRVQGQRRLKQAEKDLRSLGKVNPLALEEYAALEERYNFLSTQLNDVLTARNDLHGVIHDVDEKILTLFTEAWKDVEAEFPKVFNTLFPGGEGRLLLTEPDDMLTTGIEVEARPPGKKVKRLSLLSGGEKSLTALAMLVAIFRARPSPFYVMDEVEAALDDVNLRRLLALFEELRKDSQLIVITHQKPTMDIANVLYGVTMRGDGVTRVLSQRMQPAGQAPESK